MKAVVWVVAALAVSPSSEVLAREPKRPTPQPADVLGAWGAFDEKTGECTPDAVGVTLTSTTFTVDHGGHAINVRPVGQAACTGQRCTLNTTATTKSRTWTWVFKTPDTAVIRGSFPHELADKGVIGFEHHLKKGCQ
jgi:hypothetical protein